MMKRIRLLVGMVVGVTEATVVGLGAQESGGDWLIGGRRSGQPSSFGNRDGYIPFSLHIKYSHMQYLVAMNLRDRIGIILRKKPFIG